jgi:DNA-binding CsgD family transcriptional regulator/tetratricopeptide (TPR) repeat protein
MSVVVGPELVNEVDTQPRNVAVTSVGPRLVGRASELEAIDRALLLARGGAGHGLVLTGEPGLGKTALLDAACRRAEAASLAVLRLRATDREAATALRAGGLDALAEHGPVLVALDDVQSAEPALVESLVDVARHGVPAGALLVLAYRLAQAPEALTHAVAAAARERRVTVLELGALTAEEAGELLGSALDSRRRAALHRESGGNPFHLLELGRTKRAGVVPPAVAAAIAQEVGGASPAARTLLDGAAVAGDPFDFDLAVCAADLDEKEALAALDELGRLDLVRPTDVPARYAFRSAVFHRAVYAAAGAGFTLAAHRRAAARLERWGASPVERADHIERSGRSGDADAVAVLTAAATAAAVSEPAAAARWLDAALRLLPDDAVEQRLALLIRLATALGTMGKVGKSRARLAEALRLLASADVVLQPRLAGAIARLDHMTARHGSARALLERAVADESTRQSPELRLELAMDHWLAGEWERAAELAGTARHAGDRVAEVTATALEAACLGRLGRLDAARALVEESASLIDRLADSELAHRVEALVVLSHAERAIERMTAGARHAERGIAIAYRTGQDTWHAVLMAERCIAHLLLGHLADADAAVDATLEVAQLGHRQTQMRALTLRCWVDLFRGDLCRAIEHGKEATALVTRTRSERTNWLAFGCLGMALLEAGQPERARSLILDHAGGPGLELADVGSRTRSYETLTVAELRAGDIDAAAAWADRADEAAAAFPTPGRLSTALRARAAVEVEAGRAARAAELAGAAADGFDLAEWTIDAARARILAARGLRALGERERATTALRRAHGELDACGAWGYRDAAARELRALGAHVPRSGPALGGSDPGPDVLNPRELRVAELVAQGMTNREVAQQLCVRPKTVESQMTRILRKTGMPSRAALAAVVGRWQRAEAGR